MTDYTKATGNSATMMIRDTGFTVEFWINANNGTTWNAALPWSMVVNGVNSGNLYFNYQPGAGWRRLTEQVVTTSQNVTFKLGASGTSGFGGPTTFTQFINRQNVPPAPSYPQITNITGTSIHIVFNSQGDGGSPILEWRVGYGTSPSGPQYYWPSTGTSDITGLTPGTIWYFWAQGRNANGWGPLTAVNSATTDSAPGLNSPPTVTNVGQTSVTIKLNSGGDGGDPISLYQFGWSTTNTPTPTSIVSIVPSGGNPPTQLTNLPPGTTLYFRSRTRNSVGWSAWSNATVAKTIPGARVKHGGVWKDAVPYVKVAGVWKLSGSRVKQTGVWKEVR